MTSVMRKRKQKRPLAGEIAEAIRTGAYRTGEWLRQIDLEEKFQATRFDVRAALDKLVVLKAIEHVPNRGYRVAEIDSATLRHIREARVAIETATVASIVAAVDASTLGKLREIAERFSGAVQGGTRADWSRINSEFHHLMYHLSGNPIMEELIWNLRDRSRGSDVTVWISHEALQRSDRDHHAMLEALEARDSVRLTELITGHILRNDP
ncbi:GntR family transcriptional regulator [Bosea sp. BK604]|uniref:GntR family transcriptional regulator n=1 Tax=Bosea sp. BK604 TaxID=2512180 RepID=UPI001050109B|nr:GntR family transcriptional regulator [Bosea sp. BK604]TCR66197.1 DNA-binding GntR family transcriptional regulator [Bosea sp. BK604]